MTSRPLLASLIAVALLGAAAPKPTAPVQALQIPELSSSVAADYTGSLKALWEDLHAHPELSFRETRTAGVVVRELRAIGGIEITEQVGGTGVVGVIRNGAGPVVMLRADMDGLPIQERNGLPYESKVRQIDADGIEMPVMHACGHDVHVASLIGAARQLVARRKAWRGTIVLVFQPAEERLGGALAMLKDGLYTRFPKPDIALGLHIASGIERGKYRVETRVANSSSDAVDIVVRGVGGHGASPQQTVDPIVISSNLVMALQTLVSRSISPLEPGIVTVGVVHAGTKRNIIPEEARLELTVRADTPEVRAKLLDGIKRISDGVAKTYGVPADRMPIVSFRDEKAPPNLNDPENADKLRTSLATAFGVDRLSKIERSSMGAEDFAYYGAPEWGGVKSVFFNVGGSITDDMSKAPPHHSPLFRIEPEASVRASVEGYVVAAMTFLGTP
ncbi:putative hydrolase YxeP [Candidatus Phycosocius bacilliformis]|uniref:Putative hydrolase YxeP n=1 Tax=Candidatus Phycosocius bacilliformis TaxID=1445552 RepID=A0A2P2EBL0_9PROT|nr:amidohydrolase [Candidatus Phycosocius bacilliformis]GBF58429.1 putative hydrolase YxeP [Candidatus Phycosocius bacilliformis]